MINVSTISIEYIFLTIIKSLTFFVRRNVKFKKQNDIKNRPHTLSIPYTNVQKINLKRYKEQKYRSHFLSNLPLGIICCSYGGKRAFLFCSF